MNAQTKINANAEVVLGGLDTSHATLSTLTISETVTVGAEADSLVARLVEQARRKMLEKVAARGTFGLMAVSLAACKSDDGASLTVESGQSVSGLVIKGPLQGAFVFADLNNNGTYSDGEPNDETAADGSYTLSGVANADFAVIATTSSTTIDGSTGLVLDNVTLKATAGSAVISPITTLIEETGLSASAVATALGVPDGVDVLSFNPYAAGVDAATALSVENLSQQIVATMRGVAAAAEGAGLSRAAASDLAIKAIADVVTTNAGTAGSAALDFSNAATITTIVDAAATNAVNDGADETRMSAVKDAVSSAISNVNDKISTVTDLTSTASKAIFAISGTLASEANAAATAGTVGSITLNEAANVDIAATALEDDVEAAAEADSSTDSGTGSGSETGDDTAADQEPLASLTINFPKLDGLDAKIEADVAAAGQAVSGFYDGSGSRLVDQIETFLAEFEAGNIDVSSTGIVVDGAISGQQLALTFDNFSPNSLQSLIDTVSKFEETQNFDDLTISGGFSYLSISTADGQLVELAHTSSGIEWRNPNSLPGDVDTFVIEGTFGNQLSDYIDILSVAQNSLESGASEIDVLLNAFEALSNQIELTGISAKADGNLVFRIGDDGAPDDGTLEIFIAGIDGDNHELILSVGGATELGTGLVEAAGGFDNFLLIAEASFGVDAYIYTSDFTYELNTSIIGSEEFSIISGKYNFADEYILLDDYGTFTDLSMIVDIPPLQYEDSNGRPLSKQEYSKLIDVMEDVQDYLGGVDQPLNSLSFGFSYEHGSDVVVAASVGKIISLGEALSFFDDGSYSFVFAGYSESDVAVTEISDPQENFVLKLIGVEKSDFLEKYEQQGDDILTAVDLYFSEIDPEILSGLAT